MIIVLYNYCSVEKFSVFFSAHSNAFSVCRGSDPSHPISRDTTQASFTTLPIKNQTVLQRLLKKVSLVKNTIKTLQCAARLSVRRRAALMQLSGIQML